MRGVSGCSGGCGHGEDNCIGAATGGNCYGGNGTSDRNC